MTTTTDTEAPEIRVFHRPAGWTLPFLSPEPQDCTSNHSGARSGTPACTATAVWKVVELHDLSASIGFWCDDDLPDEHRHQGEHPAA